MPYDIATTAKEMKASLALADRAVGEAEARRLAFSFVETLDTAPAAEFLRLIEVGPAAVGDGRFDALLAAVVEHGCARRGLAGPGWVNDPSRFLGT